VHEWRNEGLAFTRRDDVGEGGQRLGIHERDGAAGSLKPKGRIVVDAGAARALAEGRSLLPAGVTAVEGGFEKGDAVSVVTAAGIELARGLVAYSRAEAAAIAGKRSDQTPAILGYRGRNEIIHRDDLVLIATDSPA
jgi:glutamate 5-kinase